MKFICVDRIENKMPFSQDMHPSNINYNLIDKPIRQLIRRMNKTGWMVTIGCCAGMATHLDQHRKHFYIIFEVKGLNGVINLVKWLSRAHEVGFEMRWKQHSIPYWQLFEVKLAIPNLLKLGKKSSLIGTTMEPELFRFNFATMGPGWFRFNLSLQEVKPATKLETLGSIRALLVALGFTFRNT